MDKITAKRAGLALQDALRAEGITDFGHYGSMIKGWIPANYMNSLELGLKPRKDGDLDWFIDLDVEGFVEFEDDPFEEGEYLPVDALAVRPVVAAAFARMGIDLLGLKVDGRSPDTKRIRYTATTPYPDWLEAYDEVNTTHPPHDGTLVAIKFQSPWAYPGRLPAYQMKDRSIRMPRETIDALLAHRRYNGQPIVEGEIDSNGWTNLKAADGSRGAYSISQGMTVTDFWGNRVMTWEAPARIVDVQDRFGLDIPYAVGGKDASQVDVEAQHGDWPWTGSDCPRP